jgi:hypothetical protein
MRNKDSMFSMSLDDGRIVFRNEQVDNHINYHPVPYDIAWKVDHKELDWKLVKEACEKKIKEKGELTLQEYLQKLKLLNVRKTKVDLKDEEEKVDERADEMISLSDVVPQKKTEKKTVLPPVEKPMKINLD